MTRGIRRIGWAALATSVGGIALGAWLPDTFLFLLGICCGIASAVTVEVFAGPGPSSSRFRTPRDWS